MKILERESFLRELKARLDEAAAGRGRIVFVCGEAGIGKTVLVNLFARSLEGTARVAVGRCDPLSTSRALGPLFDIATLLGGDVGALLEAEAPQLSLFRSVLAPLAAPGRTVVVWEDVHCLSAGTYISVKTVDHHVSPALAKLGVRTRAEVAREAARLGLADQRQQDAADGSMHGLQEA